MWGARRCDEIDVMCEKYRERDDAVRQSTVIDILVFKNIYVLYKQFDLCDYYDFIL
jgi:hypothetical protein